MALNENIIKNIANEITRNCQMKNVNVETDFIIYFIDLLLLNPKYRKIFSKSLNRNQLESFVHEAGGILTSGETFINTLKLQHIVANNYDILHILVFNRLASIETCLQPLVNEIMEAYLDEPEDEMELKKLFRKISIYIILASGLGNPGSIVTLKEGMAALHSVFPLDDLRIFVTLPPEEKMAQLNELLNIVSGVRLFNRDCKKGGDGIPDLPFDVVDAAKASLATLNDSLIIVMQRVNSLTSAIDDMIKVEEESGNVYVDVVPGFNIAMEHYKHVFDVLVFCRQYEVLIRKLITDVEFIKKNCLVYVQSVKRILEELHAAVKYKNAVPVDAVFPLFTSLWTEWRFMQNEMYLISTINKLMVLLASQQDQVKMPNSILKIMLEGKSIISDNQRLSSRVSLEEKLSLMSLKNYVAYNESWSTLKDKHVKYLGFCALCLSVGALIASNPKIGLVKIEGDCYAFCNLKMLTKFSKDSRRYINEILHYVRNNPHLINLLHIAEDVCKVQHIENLVAKVVPKKKVHEKEIQTDVHPIEERIERFYSWNLWEHKRRACQWATIVNCRTHSTQTKYSHFRSEIHSQTVEMRDKGYQTKKDNSTNVPTLNTFLFGLRRRDRKHHVWNLTESVEMSEKLKPKPVSTCTWPCIEPPIKEESVSDASVSTNGVNEFQ